MNRVNGMHNKSYCKCNVKFFAMIHLRCQVGKINYELITNLHVSFLDILKMHNYNINHYLGQNKL